ncbi:hypothetical protein L208DRAFT_1250070, partial [Tricholoma matsutake]
MPYAPATISQLSSSQPPLLSAGSITVSNLCKFEYTCKRFFSYKEIPTKEAVGHIIYSFESEFMQSWIESDSECLSSLTFAEFMIEIKQKWLPTDWEDELIQELIAPQGDLEFYQWSVSVCKVNNELEAADSLQYIPCERFRAHLIAHLNPALRLAYHASKKELDAIKDIETWIHCIVLLDLQLATHQKQISTSMALAANNAMKHTQSTNHNMSSNTATTTQYIPSSSNTALTPLVAFIAIPRLMQSNKDLLDLHQGCYKCWTFYAGHFSCTCTADCPLLEACKKVSIAHTARVKTIFKSKSMPVVGAIFGNDMDEDFIDEDFIDSDEFNECTPSPLPPLPEHLWWDCIDAPFTCAPSQIHALIDHGAPPVLISEHTIELYGLVPHTLFKPFAISAAFIPGQSIAKPVLLTQYCRLSVSSLDAHWKSRTLNAIICPNLQADVILSLDFLVKNKIVVDTELQTVIAKETNYNLLHPPDPIKARIQLQISPEHPSKFNMMVHTTGNPNFIGLITTQIQQLAAEARLSKLDQNFKCKFADHFPADIPHVRNLPNDVYHHIEVKPGIPISTAHTYSCPQKYRDGW